MKKEENGQVSESQQSKKRKGSRRLSLCCLLLIIFVLLIFIVGLVLALTVFKAKQPRTTLVSAKLDGVSPRISFPAINIQLNITLDLQLLVENRNYASFKHGSGKSLITFEGKQIGEADIPPGFIPAKGSTTFSTRLTVQVDRVLSNITNLISDVLDGEVVFDTHTRIPGRLTVLKIIKKHAVATSVCQFTIAVLKLEIKSQKCHNKAKL